MSIHAHYDASVETPGMREVDAAEAARTALGAFPIGTHPWVYMRQTQAGYDVWFEADDNSGLTLPGRDPDCSVDFAGSVL